MLVGLVACDASLAPQSLGEPAEMQRFESDPLAWEPGSLASDPLFDHRPEQDDCPEGSWGAEGDSLEVETGLCHYAWLVQALPRPVPKGAVLRAQIWHTGLDAPDPAEAHVAVVLGGEVGWEGWAAIPSDPTLWEVQLVASADVEAGELLGLHLHNHGDNAWKLGPVTIESP